MNSKTIFTIIFAAAFLLGISSVAFAGGRGAAAAQDMPATATPAPLVTPVVSDGAVISGTGAMSCPMMSGMTGTGTMPMNTSANMSNMGAMGSMGGMMMQGSNMPGMSNMSYMDERYIVLSDPTTWFSANPWLLLGWVVLGLVLLALLAGLILGVIYFARRIAPARPAPKA